MNTPQEKLITMGVKPELAAPIAARENALDDSEFEAWRIRANNLLREIHGADAIPYTYHGHYAVNGVLIPFSAEGGENGVNPHTVQPQEFAEVLAPAIEKAVRNLNKLLNGVTDGLEATQARIEFKL